MQVIPVYLRRDVEVETTAKPRSSSIDREAVRDLRVTSLRTMVSRCWAKRDKFTLRDYDSNNTLLKFESENKRMFRFWLDYESFLAHFFLFTSGRGRPAYDLAVEQTLRKMDEDNVEFVEKGCTRIVDEYRTLRLRQFLEDLNWLEGPEWDERVVTSVVTSDESRIGA